MEPGSADEVTRLLGALRDGDQAAFAALVPLVYDELRTVAHRQRRRWRGDDTLATTALVHEAYLKLVPHDRASWESRAHFLAAAARAMRHILINYSRDRRTQKRGGPSPTRSLDAPDARAEPETALSDDDVDTLLALDRALERLERVNARQCRIVECRFFGGMTIAETAAALGISTATVSRGWTLAQVRLHQDLAPDLRA